MEELWNALETAPFTLDSVTLLINPRVFWLIVLVTAILLVSLLTIIALPARTYKPEQFKSLKKYADAIGIRNPSDIQLGMSLIIIWIFLPLFGIAVVATYLLLANVVTPGVFPDVPEGNLGLGALMVALLSTPFFVWRTAVAQATARTAELALFNDKLNEASNGLHAMRQVSKPVGKLKWADVWEPDIVRRNAAIDALEGLAKERPQETGRIARMLSVYVRELSATEARPEPVPEGNSREELHKWARVLTVKRSDMQAAVQTLGRLRDIPNREMEDGDIDLSGANLQAMALSGLNFDNATLIGSQMQGANLFEAQMQGANLWQAQMQGANLWQAQMQGAELRGAVFDADSDLTNALFQYASVKSVDFSTVTLTQDQITSTFGDGSFILPTGLTRPGHWPEGDLDWRAYYAAWRKWREAQPGWNPEWGR